ncbi:hypothetical protein [Thalassoroseus pseudoceratinae]|uniref:hypothetical protein n=1 Tax=Thalassoroseus pseudoceratinae TaxID=2713176 RepID=UPI00141E224E|nr:hypothetical protein [Thalassoroseus pseudoceratinae]
MTNPQLEENGVVSRPQFQLRSLPLAMRWEVTRRHPYYQTYWTGSRNYFRNEPITNHAIEAELRMRSVGILEAIGISGEPPDPATPFAELGESELQTGWLSGAAHPITLRGMAGLLLWALSRETLSSLGVLFSEAARQDPEDELSGFMSAYFSLRRMPNPDLDNFVDEPIVTINPAASARVVNEAMNALLSQWREERELSEHRNRSDKFSEYLEVWDLREGWNGASYDISQEKLFRQIADETGRTLPTIISQYRRAFELIIGHPYSPRLWWRTVGDTKLVDFGFTQVHQGGRRPQRSPTRRLTPEATLGTSIESVQPFDRNSQDEYTYEELVMDIEALLDQGKNDAEIIETLEMRPDRPETQRFIDYVRSRKG